MNKTFKKDSLEFNVWKSKYAMKDKKGNVQEKSPEEMHKRLAVEFVGADTDVNINKEGVSLYGKERSKYNEEQLLNYFKGFKYIVPQGRVMAGLGVYNSFRSLSNCLVLPSPKDSYSSILYVDTMLVSAAKRGCGFGIDLSNLRYEGALTNNAADTSTGVVPFMERYSNSTREVGQNSRRGACLLGIDSHHPDVFKFLSAKFDLNKVTGANISVKCRDEFFEAVKKGEKYDLRFGDYAEQIEAKDLWNELTFHSHNNSEPGIFIWDRINDYDPVSVYEDHKITLSNACGEQPMSQLDTCRLIVVNLYSYIDNSFTDKASLNEDLLYKMCYEQLWLGDLLVDLELKYIDRILGKINSDPEPESQKAVEKELWEGVKDKARRGRRVGCGITGLGDMIAAMNIRYGSKESLELTEKVMYIKMKAELNATIDLAILKGSFPDYNHELEYTDNQGNNSFYSFLKETYPEEYERMKKYGRRNINWNTVSPTGTTSLMTQTSSGCEPVFMPVYKRRRKINPNDKFSRVDFVDQSGDQWEEYNVFHHKFLDWVDINGKNVVGIDKFEVEDLTDEEVEELVKQSPYHQACANDLNWKERVDMQAILQKYTTSAISSTVNLPSTVKQSDIGDLFMYAYEKGLKGITIYRDGSRSGVLISGKEEKKEEGIVYNDAPKRPKNLPVDVYHKMALGKEFTILVGLLKGKPYEIFAFEQLSQSDFPKEIERAKLTRVRKNHYRLTGYRGEQKFVIENIVDNMNDDEKFQTRDFSRSLRHGEHPKYICNDIDKSSFISSFRKVVSRVLKNYLTNEDVKDKCPDCGGELKFESGCKQCLNPECNWSACG